MPQHFKGLMLDWNVTFAGNSVDSLLRCAV